MTVADMLRLPTTTTTGGTILTATTTAILAGIGGYLLGQVRSFSRSDVRAGRRGRLRSSSSSEEDNDQPAGQNASFKGDRNEEYKLVLVVRTDLGMSRGSLVLCLFQSTS